ncbi:gustatory receptor for sugar taste 64e-like [Diorhabda sublineata]|uniref:gustatory receptor for sugar taste 64e-like n=1 Tax=Diorhabda sublineata TaxID=1163346 RepID=UPI0024E05278|nr:gustatory receptor for sugar taste 64e-like [Diorhabda sublineata]
MIPPRALYAFYIGGIATLLLYLQLSIRWPKLIKTWCQMDKIMNKRYGYPVSLDLRLRLCLIICITLTLTDYLLCMYNRYIEMVNKYGDDYDYKVFFNNTLPQLFKIVPLNVASAVYCTVLNTHSTLTSTFNDLFIILLSISLALRFKQVTQRLEKNVSKFESEEFWIEIREDYDRLSTLCKELDENISYIILLSYSINSFFLLIQLYESLEAVSGLVGRIYFITSFVHQIFRIVSVSLYAAWINDESLEPMNILNSVPSHAYNTEVKRLLMQISFDNVALTGCKMFKITRGIILSIAGAVVTYELVLIQFNSETQA